MRTTGSDELFKLIHSLSTDEKGYFKKFAKRHTTGGNIYLKLFDAINKQKEFEEKTLKKKFKNYAVVKVYLFDMIMQALLVSQSRLQPQQAILRGMLQINILMARGISEKALKLLKDSQELAEQHEQYSLL